MSDTSGSGSPFGGFPQNGMMEKMWEMMKLNPFAASAAGGSGGPSLGMMSDMLAPLTNVEELDKRITDMRAVEQWLKLNLNMLQSAIQALEVQRATLATLRAFGAYAKEAADGQADAPSFAAFWPGVPAAAGGKGAAAAARSHVPAPEEKGADSAGATEAGPSPRGVNDPSFDPAGWWNMLQSQFNNLAALAMVQGSEGSGAKGTQGDGAKAMGKKPSARKPAAKKAPARKDVS